MSPAADAAPLSARARALLAAGGDAAWSIADEALRRHRAGADVLLLTLGDPADPPHPEILAATGAALAAGRTHYSPLLGEPALRAAIAARAGVPADRVVVTPGAQHAALAVIGLVAGPGDTVILSDPHYATYPAVVAASGAQAVAVPARPDLSIDVAAIAAAITPATRAILLNSPANPSGSALDAAALAALGALARTHDLWLVVDEVYSAFRFTGLHVGALAHGPPERTVVIDSLSKSHAMTGYRLGWAIAPPPLVRALGAWSAAALFGVSQFVQDAALAALALPEGEFATYREGFRARARQVVDRARGIAGLAAHLPAGGMFVMLDARAIDPSDTALARRLLDDAGVAVMPGSGFGSAARGHLRVSLTPAADTLDRAFDRIARVIH